MSKMGVVVLLWFFFGGSGINSSVDQTPPFSLSFFQDKQEKTDQVPDYSVLGLTDQEFQDWISEPNTIDFESTLFRVLERLGRSGFDRWHSKTTRQKMMPARPNQRLRVPIEGRVLQITKISGDGASANGFENSVFAVEGESRNTDGENYCYEVVLESKGQNGNPTTVVVWVKTLPPFFRSLLVSSEKIVFASKEVAEGKEVETDFKPDQESEVVSLDLGGSVIFETEGVMIGRTNRVSGLSGLSRITSDGSSVVVLARNLKWKPKRYAVVKRILDRHFKTTKDERLEDDIERLAVSLVRLGKLGIDAGYFGEPKAAITQQMDAREGEVFHQMLIGLNSRGLAMDKDSEIEIADGVPEKWRSPTPIKIEETIKDFRRLRPLWVELRGNVVQVVKVNLALDDLGRRQGLEDYYLVHMRIRTGKTLNIRFGKDIKKTYKNSFPVTVAVMELPAGLKIGENGRQFFRVEGHFLRLWQYQSAATIEDRSVQYSPLIVAGSFRPESAPAQPPTAHPLATLLLIPVALTILGVFIAGVITFRYRRNSFSKKYLKKVSQN